MTYRPTAARPDDKHVSVSAKLHARMQREAERRGVSMRHLLERAISSVPASGPRSLKRIAWAYGCSKKDSDEERESLAALMAKVAEAFRCAVIERDADGMPTRILL